MILGMIGLLQADPIIDNLISRLAERADIVILLLLILVGGAREMWVFGWVYKALRRDHDYWRDLAVRGTEVAQRAVKVAEKGQS